MHKILLLLVICGFLISAETAASDQEALRKVQSEPASMFDLGMYRMERNLSAAWISDEYGVYAVNVPPNFENKIPGKILVRFYFKTGFLGNSNKRCAEIIQAFRKRSFIMDSEYSFESELSSYFLHFGFARRGYDMDEKENGYDSDFQRSVAKLFTISAQEGGTNVSCYGAYIGNEVTHAK